MRGASPTRTTTTVIIGAGQAALAMSRCLTDRSVDHALLERGRVANAWRTERWDSLRLLTPNWMTRLPGRQPWSHRADAERDTRFGPEGYLAAGDVASLLVRYGRRFDAPVVEGVTVEQVTPTGDGFVVDTDRGPWSTRSVVVATGPGVPHRPAIGADLPPKMRQLAAIEYRNPHEIEGRRVLIVGGSASGIQLADELARHGLEVTLAFGEHIRLPRRYRGMDIYWWMDQLGLLDDRYDRIQDLGRVRRLPSAQLLGSDDHRDLDVNTVSHLGVEVVGRLVGVVGSNLQFSGSLPNICQAADLKQNRLLSAIDDHAKAHGLDDELPDPHRPERTQVRSSRLGIPACEFDTVIWATGFRPNNGWLPERLLDPKGSICHDGGVMPVPGMYVLGLPFLRTRKSALIDGVGRDASALSDHLVAHLAIGAGSC